VLSRLLARIGLTTREQRGWAWYDWANSVYFTTVITAVFPSFYATYAAKGLEPAQATARFGLITTVSVAAIAIVSPVLGALADYSGVKKLLLGIFMAVGVVSCAGSYHAREAVGSRQWDAGDRSPSGLFSPLPTAYSLQPCH